MQSIERLIDDAFELVGAADDFGAIGRRCVRQRNSSSATLSAASTAIFSVSPVGTSLAGARHLGVDVAGELDDVLLVERAADRIPQALDLDRDDARGSGCPRTVSGA